MPAANTNNATIMRRHYRTSTTLILNTLLIMTATSLIANTGCSEAQSDIPPQDRQIAAATSPAPEAMQGEATVLGYNAQGELTTLRQGTNELICLADNPDEDEEFHVACYHEDLEPFMQRGRELSAEGYSSNDIRDIRRQEIDDGDLPMPEKPMSLYSLTGTGNAYDYETETLREAEALYVVYIPYATQETTGMPTTPYREGAPWLMDPGEPWAHIMVSPGEPLGEDVAQ